MSAVEWLARGKTQASAIDAFTDYWRGFNALYGHGSTAELGRIKGFIAAQVTPAVAEKVLTQHPAEVGYLLSTPVIDMRGNGRDTAEAAAAFQASQDPVVRLGELLAVIYQVRCNLEHGQKSPTVARDLKLCECAAPIVGALLEEAS